MKNAMDLLQESFGYGWFSSFEDSIEHCRENVLKSNQTEASLFERCEKLFFAFKENPHLFSLPSVIHQLRDSSSPPLNTEIDPLIPHWRAKYVIAIRILPYLPAMRTCVEHLKNLDPSDRQQQRSPLERLESMIIKREEEVHLRNLVQIVAPIYSYSNEVSSKISNGNGSPPRPFISEMYPKIHHVIETLTSTLIMMEEPNHHHHRHHHETYSFQNEIVQQLSKRFNCREMSSHILLATFLNPSSMNHTLFEETVQVDHNSLSLREYTKQVILEMLINKKEANWKRASSSEKEGFDRNYWMEEFQHELDQYQIQSAFTMSQVSQRGGEEEKEEEEEEEEGSNFSQWWKLHKEDLPHLSALARIYFSTPMLAGGGILDRIFSENASVLVRENLQLSDANVTLFLNLQSLYAFVSKLEGEGEVEAVGKDNQSSNVVNMKNGIEMAESEHGGEKGHLDMDVDSE
jgi:hypothetical protein